MDIIGLVNLVLNSASANDYPEADISGDGMINIMDIVQLVTLVLDE